MTTFSHQGARPVLSEALLPSEGTALWIKRAVLVMAGVAALAVAAKIKVALWPSPVPITLQTFVVLTVGAAYGPRLGLVTIFGYLLIGAIGFDVFTGSSAEKNGIAYMMGGTGGYLLGYLLSTLALGYFARRGWDRNVLLMAVAMLVGTALIYIPGVFWLQEVIVAGGMFDAQAFGSIWQQTLTWGLTPFLIGDAIKLALAALLLPAMWKLVGSARG
ncbi:MAG: biotin transporter BioY [Pseudomonadota bacterium]